MFWRAGEKKYEGEEDSRESQLQDRVTGLLILPGAVPLMKANTCKQENEMKMSCW